MSLDQGYHGVKNRKKSYRPVEGDGRDRVEKGFPVETLYLETFTCYLITPKMFLEYFHAGMLCDL